MKFLLKVAITLYDFDSNNQVGDPESAPKLQYKNLSSQDKEIIRVSIRKYVYDLKRFCKEEYLNQYDQSQPDDIPLFRRLFRKARVSRQNTTLLFEFDLKRPKEEIELQKSFNEEIYKWSNEDISLSTGKNITLCFGSQI